jgi:hypothetical protein
MKPEKEIFEPCNSNQTKNGRGGKRPNSGKKSSGIETVTVRIDKRLLNAVTEIKGKFKTTESLDGILTKPTAKNDDVAKLENKIERMERKHREAIKFCCDERLKMQQEYKAQISTMAREIALLKMDADMNKATVIYKDGIDRKLIKRLIQFCHPEKNHDRKDVATDLTKILNNLA